MKVLVIPDVHLKPWIFERASQLMKEKKPDTAVCLMDIADDWNKQYCLELYDQTYDAAIAFAKEFPQALWCYGNHDLSYVWGFVESGYSHMAKSLVCSKIAQLNNTLSENNKIGIVCRIDNILFSHGGLSQKFVQRTVTQTDTNDTESVIRAVNELSSNELWGNDSPLWLRPQDVRIKMYKQDELLQVVGHTPVNGIVRAKNLISTDVFSTYPDGSAIGSEEFMLIDSETWEFRTLK